MYLSLKITKSYKIVTEHGERYFPLVQVVVRYYNVRIRSIKCPNFDRLVNEILVRAFKY